MSALQTLNQCNMLKSVSTRPGTAQSAFISQSVVLATELEGFNSLEVRNAVITAHRKVMDAIRAQDGEAAARRMGCQS